MKLGALIRELQRLEAIEGPDVQVLIRNRIDSKVRPIQKVGTCAQANPPHASPFSVYLRDDR